MDVQTRVFDTIPREIIVRTLHNCDYVTIIRFSLTCKRAYEVVSSSVGLRLHIELEINGFEIADRPSKGVSNYSLILKEIRDYQNAWLNFRLSPMVRQRIGSSNAEVPNWELRSGIYYGEFRVSELDNDNDDDDLLVDHTQIAILGSSNIPPPTNFEKKFSFCTADPKQDLGVLVEDERADPGLARFHFRSITTGRPHPLAEQPIITVRFDTVFLRENDLLDELMSTNPEIMGNYFVVKFDWRESNCDISEILLWDWRVGALLARVCFDHTPPSFTFLDKEHLLVYSAPLENDARMTRLALLVYHIPIVCPDHKVPHNADFCPSLYSEHSPIIIFEFPQLHPSWEIVGYNFILGSVPLPGDVVYAKSATLLCSHVTTLGLEFRTWNNPRRQPYDNRSREGNPTDFHVFVSTRHLLMHLMRRQSEGVTTRIIPWSQWGATATRWFIGVDSIKHPTGTVYGSQYIRSTTLKSGEAQLVSIVDFNAPVIKRHAYTSAAASQAKRTSADRAEKTAVLEGKGMTADRLFHIRIASTKLPMAVLGQAINQEVLTETVGSDIQTTIRAGFKDPVVSCLPYRVVTRMQRMPLHGHWRTHGEYLVGVPRRNRFGTENPYMSLYKLDLPSQD